MPPPPSPSTPPPVVWWTLWTAFFVGLTQIFYFLEPAATAHPAAANPFVAALGLLPVAASIVTRWTVLPRVSNGHKAFVFFIIGMAFAEATCFLGLFLFPAFRTALFGFSLLGIAQFAPVFTRRFA